MEHLKTSSEQPVRADLRRFAEGVRDVSAVTNWRQNRLVAWGREVEGQGGISCVVSVQGAAGQLPAIKRAVFFVADPDHATESIGISFETDVMELDDPQAVYIRNRFVEALEPDTALPLGTYALTAMELWGSVPPAHLSRQVIADMRGASNLLDLDYHLYG